MLARHRPDNNLNTPLNKYSILKNVCIQYVGNDQSTRKQFLENIKLHIGSIYFCNDGEQALTEYHKYKPDLLVSELNLADMSGLEVASELRIYDPDLPILITSEQTNADKLIEAIRVGIDAYIIKPINITQLLDDLCNIIDSLQVKNGLIQQAQYLHVMMDSNPNMMMMVSEYRVEYVNKTMQAFLGYQPSLPGFYDDFCLFDYIRDLDNSEIVFQTRMELIQYFLDTPEKQHILRFKHIKKTKSAFVISMTHQKDLKQFVFSLADITELANENKRLEFFASTDKLTGIANRATFDQVIQRYIDQSEINNEAFILLFFDIDHFKRVNDNHGHDIGDKVLQDVTQLISGNIRKEDFFARWGGEEFAILLRNNSIKQGIKTAEHLRLLISNFQFSTIKRITCSFSVVQFNSNDNAESLLKRADSVLYRAKAAGRNCVKTYQVEDTLESIQLVSNSTDSDSERYDNSTLPLVLIADDDYMQRLPMRSALEKYNFRVIEAENGLHALEMFQQHIPDLVILDVIMPEMDGFEACRKIRQHPQGEHIPILVLTGLDNVDSINQAYEDGATDFLSKPINWTLLAHKVRYLFKASEISQTLANREIELLNTQFDVIERLAKAAEYKDPETGNHIIRMSHYSFELGKAIGLNDELCNILLKASPMHDVGKIGIPDHILLKPGKLTLEEFEIIKTHSGIGAELLSKNHSFLMETAHVIALTHHEKWDGSGYPNALAGEEIPVLGRVCAVTDVFDALTTNRPYKKAWDVEQAFNKIKEGSGSHFDPQMVEKFIEIKASILEIKEKYKD